MDGDGLSNQVKDELRFQTFVFFDIEATGLPSATNPPRITELCFKALDVKHFSALKPLLFKCKDSKNFEDILPRVANTLKLCFNPGAMVPEKVTDITGLSNDLLENQSRFKPESVNLLKLFLENLPQPICLVAHNGSRYDYPLLQAELVNTGTVLNMTLQVTSIFTGFSVKIANFQKIPIYVLPQLMLLTAFPLHLNHQLSFFPNYAHVPPVFQLVPHYPIVNPFFTER